MKTKKLLSIFIILISFISGCGKGKYDPNNFTGTWHGSITLPGGELPFQFEIKNRDRKLKATLLNGFENVKIKDLNFENDSLTLYFPAFNTKLRLTNDKNFKKLKGNLTLIKSGGVQQIMPIEAKRLKSKKNNYYSAINIGGRWKVDFVDDEGNKTISVGEFKQIESKINGTFLTTTGDYRFLNGFVEDSSLQLSTFDGAHVFLFRAKLGKDGKLNGDFWSGIKWHETWEATRDENAALPDEDSLTFLKKGYEKISFTFEDVNGKKISLDDEKYKGKVVLVNLAGSWCPNCHDEARFLSDYYNRNKDKGLEIIALMFENYKDKSKNINQIKKFRDKFNIKYDLLYAGINNKGGAAKLLPMLNTILAFPTTIYIDRKGKVRKISTGFTGPGTGEHYLKFQEKFDLFVSSLLNE